MYCRSCGAKTDVRKARCPVCGADQRKRRFSFFLLLCVILACAIFTGVLALGARLQTEQQPLTTPTAYTASTAAAKDRTGTETVFVTRSGSKYHKDGCTYLNDSKEAISLQEAQELGYEPCAVCFGN